MLELLEITAIENRYVNDGEPCLQLARDALVDRWNAGATDRETLLRLFFLQWYSCSEPPFLTGLDNPLDEDLFYRLLEQLGGATTDDPEVMLVVGHMAGGWGFCFGDEQAWTQTGSRLLRRYEELPPERRLRPEHFRGRGAYGNYFVNLIPRP